MTFHSFVRGMVRTLAVGAAAASLAATGASAAPCEGAHCKAQAQSPQVKPLTLKKFMRKPVAKGAARTVKKKNGEYANVAIKRPNKQPAAAPEVAPEALSPAAAQAFASYELARVRVVTPADDNPPGLMTDSTAVASNAETVINVESVQVVRSDEINDIDRKADTTGAVSLDTLSRTLAATAEPKPEGDSWFQKMLLLVGGAFAAAAALVRAVFG